ncbi:type II toxin-antitoxin system PemK/MazF family toxin [Candidatus Woesearchaeota archaeon]|nr:type II toxin-antitoxin system PemK/MazF family toxin [Candidatus Woesearchaeota archaeon]
MMRRGEIWLVNLDPTVGHEIKKSRPSIIIQNNLGNQFSPLTIIAPITSNTDKIYPFEVSLHQPVVVKDSKVLLNHVRTVDKSRLIRKLGVIDDETMLKVDEAIKISLGLR